MIFFALFFSLVDVIAIYLSFSLAFWHAKHHQISLLKRSGLMILVFGLGWSFVRDIYIVLGHTAWIDRAFLLGQTKDLGIMLFLYACLRMARQSRD